MRASLILLGTSILSHCNKKHVEDFMTGSMHNLSIEIDMICVNSTVQYFQSPFICIQW